jgi:hypothetical protein
LLDEFESVSFDGMRGFQSQRGLAALFDGAADGVFGFAGLFDLDEGCMVSFIPKW